MQKAVQPKVTVEKKLKRAGAVTRDKRNYFSASDTLLSHRAEWASSARTSLFLEAEMADRTDHMLTHHALRRSELGSVDADFLHRVAGASSFQHASLNSRGEERFTPVLHGALRRLLHRSAAHKARHVKQINAPKTVRLPEGWHDVRAGATPPLGARCVTVFCGVAPALTGTSCQRFIRLHTHTREFVRQEV
jgi:hypothetical protein